MKSLADMIAADRERLNSEREKLLAERAALDDKLAGLDREFAAINAYEAAKAGKAPATTTRSQARQRSRRGSKRDELVTLIRNSAGLSRGEILERMGLKGDKSGEMSVSNALTALTKSGSVSREGGKYHATAS